MRWRRFVALGVAGLMIAVGLLWLYVGAIGLDQFRVTPDQPGFCEQREVPYGVALVTLAVLGWCTVAWTLRHAVPVALGRAASDRYLLGVAVTGLLAAAFVIVVVPLNPKGEFGPC